MQEPHSTPVTFWVNTNHDEVIAAFGLVQESVVFGTSLSEPQNKKLQYQELAGRDTFGWIIEPLSKDQRNAPFFISFHFISY